MSDARRACRDPGDTGTSTLGANQVFTPSLHEVGGGRNTNIADKPAGQARNAYRVPGAQQPVRASPPSASAQSFLAVLTAGAHVMLTGVWSGVQQQGGGPDGFMC